MSLFPRTYGQLIAQLRGLPVADFGLDVAHWGLVNGKKLAPWAVPAVIAGAWLAWPTLTDEFKEEVGLKAKPEPAADADA